MAAELIAANFEHWQAKSISWHPLPNPAEAKHDWAHEGTASATPTQSVVVEQVTLGADVIVGAVVPAIAHARVAKFTQRIVVRIVTD